MLITMNSEDRKKQRKKTNFKSKEKKTKSKAPIFLYNYIFFLGIFWIVNDGAVDRNVFFQIIYLEALTPKVIISGNRAFGR